MHIDTLFIGSEMGSDECGLFRLIDWLVREQMPKRPRCLA